MAESEYEMFWREALSLTRQEMGEQAFPGWFELEFLRFNDDTITAAVPSKFYCDRIRQKRYDSLIESKLYELTGRKIAVDFEVVPVKERPEAPENESDGENGPITAVNATGQEKKKPASPAAPPKKEKHPELSESYTFERYIVGDNNNYAVNVAKAISLNPGTTYNPFLIYGGVGLGKTHLMQAIGNFIHNNSDNKIICIHSENFLNEFLRAIPEKTTASFKNKFRMTDVLLLDDIQFFEGKEQVQEELFHTLNTLLEMKKQIVFTCDRPIEEMKKVPERLLSRYRLATKVDLQPPKYETRCAILKSKFEEQDITIADNVIDFISKNISTNIRDLEGAINTLIPYVRLQNTPITIDIAQRLLRDMLSGPKLSNLSIDIIIRTVADYFSLTPNDLKGRKRNKQVSLARHVAMYITYEIGDYSTTEIGREFGGRDHSTVMHSCDKAKEMLQSDPTMEPTVNNLKRMIRENSVKI